MDNLVKRLGAFVYKFIWFNRYLRLGFSENLQKPDKPGVMCVRQISSKFWIDLLKITPSIKTGCMCQNMTLPILLIQNQTYF